MIGRARDHWPEYLAEAWGLGFFMLSACAFGALLFHPGSPLVPLVPSALLRRSLMGLAMAATALINVHSPWGKRSGCHLNPAVTLTFARLGKVHPHDARWYVAAQFAGGFAGTLLAISLLGMWLSHPQVNYVATVPGPGGHWPAFLAEALISLVLMLTVLAFTSRPAWAPYTGRAVATLIALWITFESPISGMSMNPARSLASAIPAREWSALWIYFTAPPLGMLLGAALFVRSRQPAPSCAKLDHDPRVRCIFCGHPGNSAAPSLISSPTTTGNGLR